MTYHKMIGTKLLRTRSCHTRSIHQLCTSRYYNNAHNQSHQLHTTLYNNNNVVNKCQHAHTTQHRYLSSTSDHNNNDKPLEPIEPDTTNSPTNTHNNNDQSFTMDDIIKDNVSETDLDATLINTKQQANSHSQHIPITSNQLLQHNTELDTSYTDILDINNPPKLTSEQYKLIKQHNLTAADFDLGSHTELQPLLQFIIDGVNNNTLQYNETEYEYADNDELVDDTNIEAELGFGLDNQPPQLYKVGLPVDKLECQFCKQSDEFLYKVRQAKRLGETYTMDGNNTSSDLSDNILLHYSNVELLYTYLNERGMITPRHENGNCAKHQRKLANEIKRARYIGLLSYVTRFKVDEEFVAAQYGSVIQTDADRRNNELAQQTAAQVERHRVERQAMQQMIGTDDRDNNNVDQSDVDTTHNRRRKK